MAYDPNSRPFPPAPPVRSTEADDLHGVVKIYLVVLLQYAAIWIGGFVATMTGLFILYKLAGN
jgi:hypothetical protein